MLIEIVIYIIPALMTAFLLYKTVECILGLSYRHKWVIVTDIVIAAVFAMGFGYMQAMGRFIRPGTERYALIGYSLYFALLVVLIFGAYVIDKRRQRRNANYKITAEIPLE